MMLACTGACGLHALQVGLQTISPKSDREKVITIGLGAQEAKASGADNGWFVCFCGDVL